MKNLDETLDRIGLKWKLMMKENISLILAVPNLAHYELPKATPFLTVVLIHTLVCFNHFGRLFM